MVPLPLCLLPDWLPTGLELTGADRFYLFAGLLGAIILIMFVIGILRVNGVR